MILLLELPVSINPVLGKFTQLIELSIANSLLFITVLVPSLQQLMDSDIIGTSTRWEEVDKVSCQGV